MVKDVLSVYECQGPKSCKCELYTVKVSHKDNSKYLVFTFLSKGGHEPWHPDNVEPECLERFLMNDPTINKESRKKIEDIRLDIQK